MADRSRWRTVVALGVAQTLAWASSYYLPAILAAPMARELGVSTSTVFAGFSLALVASALTGPFAGRAIDRRGGRPVLLATNVLFAVSLTALALARDPVTLFAAWILMGIAMGSGLYEAAFSAIVRLYGSDSRNAITGITLIAGFASTVGWPLSALMASTVGWRGACAGWALLHLLVALPLNASLPHAPPPAPELAAAGAASRPDAGRWSRHDVLTAGLLAVSFAVTWFISTAMATHLPRLLQMGGASLAAAIGIAALVGPAQVAARLAEFGLLRRFDPLTSARTATLGHPIGAVLFALVGPPAAIGFALLHGAGNGLMTISKGTLPLALFGPHGYGARQGLIVMPSRFAQAVSPFAFGWLLDQMGAQALWVSAAIGLMGTAALLLVRRHSPEAPPPGERGTH